MRDSPSPMGSNPPATARSPEKMSESPFKKKEVLLFEWWLMKSEEIHNENRLSVGGFTRIGEGVAIFKSAPIIKRHDHCTLETADGITLRIQGPINQSRTIDNGFPLEASNAFLFGFPITWDEITGDFSANKPSDCRIVEDKHENTLNISSQKKTVLLRNWWLRKAKNEADGSSLAVGGFTECGKAMRLFDSSPIIKRHDAYTLDTADGVTIRIEGFINKERTLDNGFPPEACKTFLIGFPTTWTEFASGIFRDKSSHVGNPLSVPGCTELSKDSLEHACSRFPVKSGNTIINNVPSTSNRSVDDFATRLREAIQKFTTSVSRCNPSQVPLVGRGSHHLSEKSIYDKNWLQDDEHCQINTIDAHSNNKVQVAESCVANLRDCSTGNNDYATLHTTVVNASVNYESSHTEGAGCFTGALHVDRLPQGKSLNHEKLGRIQDAALNISKTLKEHPITKNHHAEGLRTNSANNLCDIVVGKDHQREETAQKNYEKLDECSIGRPEIEIPGLKQVEENHHGEEQECAKFRTKPVRRSLRLKSVNKEKVHGEFQDNSQHLKGTHQVPLGGRGSHHFSEKSIYDKNCLQDDVRCRTNTRDTPSNNKLQDDDSIGADLRDHPTDNNDYEVGHSIVGNDSENHETSHTNGAGCFTGDLHVDRLSQGKSLNNKKLECIPDFALSTSKTLKEHPVTKGHHDEGLGTSSACNLCAIVVGKDNQREETAQENYEKLDECSIGRPEIEIPGLAKVEENLHGEGLECAKLRAKPVRRSLRLKLLNHENFHGVQDKSQLLKGTKDMNCPNLASDGSKTSMICSPQFLNETSDMNHANLSPDRSKTYAGSQLTCIISKKSGLPSTPKILLSSAGVFSEENQGGQQHSINTCLGVTPKSKSASKYASAVCLGQTFSSDCTVGLAEASPENSKTVTLQTAKKRMLRCSKEKKGDQSARGRMKAEQNVSRNQSSSAYFEENISFSSASHSRRKAKNVEASTQTQKVEDKAQSHKMGGKTVWLSNYTDVYRTPLTRHKKDELTILTAESLNLKRSRSGRLLIPRLDCAWRVMYEPDGSFFGTAAVDGSCGGTAGVVMPTSPSKGRGTTAYRRKRRRTAVLRKPTWYHMTYEGSTSTLSGKDQWDVFENVYVEVPKNLRPRRKPKKRGLKNFSENSKISHKCSCCGHFGHHKTSCKNPLTSEGFLQASSSHQEKLPIRRAEDDIN